MIQLRFLNDSDKRVQAYVRNLSPKMLQFIVREMKVINETMANEARANAGGKVLKQRSGNLVRAIRALPLIQSPQLIKAIVQVAGVPYARVHEYGGLGSYVIKPKNAKALRFVSGKFVGPFRRSKAGLRALAKSSPGAFAFARRVVHPPAKERPFMRPALGAIAPTVSPRLRAAIARAIKE